jgi:hypothetical protein
MSTLMHSCQLVSAYLYRMQDRSPIAEAAWGKATYSSISETIRVGQTPVRRLNAVRNKTIGLIIDGDHFRPERARAIAAIDEAVHTTVEVDLRDFSSGMLSPN